MFHPASSTAPRGEPSGGMYNLYLCAFQGETRANTRVEEADEVMAHPATCPKQ
jgi:hypothetical protein